MGTGRRIQWLFKAFPISVVIKLFDPPSEEAAVGVNSCKEWQQLVLFLQGYHFCALNIQVLFRRVASQPFLPSV